MRAKAFISVGSGPVRVIFVPNNKMARRRHGSGVGMGGQMMVYAVLVFITALNFPNADVAFWVCALAALTFVFGTIVVVV